MIPLLNSTASVTPAYLKFLKSLKQSSFQGDIETSHASRLSVATDNSIYQVLPQAVLFPKHSRDVQLILQLAHQKPFQHLKFTPRGGGTGTNGQSLGQGVVIDASRYMNKILEMNLEAGWVRVQPGVVLDQLNAELKPHQVFFAPTLSPSNRATLGGMISTDACGKGSRVYGRTSEHVIELKSVLCDGSLLHSQGVNLDELEQVKQGKSMESQIYQEVCDSVLEHKELIQETFPKIQRFMTGYNLAKVFADDGQTFNLNYLLAGSEGTLAYLVEAKLKLTPLAKHKILFVIAYDSFQNSLADAQTLLKHKPSAIETIDDTILNLAKKDVVYDGVKDKLSTIQKDFKTINLVELSSSLPKELLTKQQNLEKELQERVKSGKICGFVQAEESGQIEKFWNVRKKGVGLLGAFPGERRPVPFIEDTAVPPEKLSQYIMELCQEFDRIGLRYGLFGHVDVGCLHVRPALDLKTEEDEQTMKHLSDFTANLVQKYGGVMWAEHGRGFRSQYTEQYFGKTLNHELRRIKGVFDPNNQLNPGKIAVPLTSNEKLVQVEGSLRGQLDRTIAKQLWQAYSPAVHCNGNGLCFDYDDDHLMCPSYKATRNHLHSPKGRSSMIREWIRQLSEKDYTASFSTAEQFQNQTLFFKKLLTLIQDKISRKQTDFSHQVYDAMSGCLSCKACGTYCPVRVDIPSVKAHFLEQYHSRYFRHPRDYLIGFSEWIASIQVQIPRISNLMTHSKISLYLLQKYLGMIDPPPLSEQTWKALLKKRGALHTKEIPYGLSEDQRKRSVILLPDAFSSFYDVPQTIAVYDLFRLLGFSVYVAPFLVNGKPLYIKGFVKQFLKVAQKNWRNLYRLAQSGVSIVGLEPSVVMTYRDEYLRATGREDLGFQVLLIQEFLTERIERLSKIAEKLKIEEKTQYYLFSHCMERGGAKDAPEQWRKIFAVFGLDLQPVESGCCGMAGAYGHESQNFQHSRSIYLSSWERLIQDHQPHQILVDGFSCRKQTERFGHFTPEHPAKTLLKHLSMPAKI